MRQTKLDDLIHQINKLVTACTIVLERFARSFEEIDSNRLALEEIRELLKDHFGENARWADKLSRRMDRLEEYTVLAKLGDRRGTDEIENKVKGEHVERTMREELGAQQEQLLQYHKNVDRVKLKIAKYGETVPLVNELEDYQREIAKITEGIERIRDALNN